MKKVILFDLDGTVLNTLLDLSASLNETITSYGYKKIKNDIVRKYVGNGIKDLIKRSVNYDTKYLNSMYNDFLSYYEKNYAVYTKPYPNIINILNKLKAEGIKLGLLTNKNIHITKKLVNKFFPNTFDLVLGDGLGIEKKPSKEMMEFVIKKFNCQISDVLYIGDSDIDIKFANNANCDKIIVSYGFRDKEDLLLKTNYVIENTTDLENEINKFLNM